MMGRAAPSVFVSIAFAACGAPTVAPPAAQGDAGAPAPARDGGSRDAGPVASDAPVFVGSWGGLGTAPGEFVEPSSVELDSTGVVIVAGHEDRVQRFTRDGTLIDIFGEPGTGDGQFDHPHGLAVDRRRGDLVYVGDQENGRLQVFTATGAFVRQWGDDGFQHIHDVGIDPATGDVFVGDLETHRLRKFSATGEVLFEIGGRGTGPAEFDGIWGVSTDSDGNVYVADTYNRRIQKLDRSGEYIAEWNTFRGRAFTKPTGVFVDHDDVVYVCDSLAETILRFDTDGTPLDAWNLRDIVGVRTEPEDIVIDADGVHVYVAEVFAHTVLHLVSAR
jgi:DNA-binding beta-propeller fold protein YncE